MQHATGEHICKSVAANSTDCSDSRPGERDEPLCELTRNLPEQVDFPELLIFPSRVNVPIQQNRTESLVIQPSPIDLLLEEAQTKSMMGRAARWAKEKGQKTTGWRGLQQNPRKHQLGLTKFLQMAVQDCEDGTVHGSMGEGDRGSPLDACLLAPTASLQDFLSNESPPGSLSRALVASRSFQTRGSWNSSITSGGSLFSANGVPRVRPNAGEDTSETELAKNFLTAKLLQTQPMPGPETVSGDEAGVFQQCVDGMYMRACLRPPCLQDKRFEELKSRSTWFRPLLLSKDPFARRGLLLLLLLLAAMQAIWAAAIGVGLYSTRQWAAEASQFRFVPARAETEQRQRLTGKSVVEEFDFALRWKGCLVTAQFAKRYDDEGAVTLSFETPQRISGWCVEHRASLSGQERMGQAGAFRLMVMDSDEHGAEWRELQSSVWLAGMDGRIHSLGEPRGGGGARGCRELWPGWGSALPGVGLGMAWVVLALVAVGLARLGKGDAANRVLAGGTACAAVANLVVGATTSVGGRGAEGFMAWVLGVLLVWVLVLVSRPRRLLHGWIAGVALLHLVAVGVERTVMWDAGWTVVVTGELYLVLLLLVLVAAVEARRSAHVRTARQLFSADAALFEAAWARVLETQGCVDALATLAERCEELQHQTSASATPLQRRSPRANAEERGSNSIGAVLAVRSLDQLHTQALVVVPLLRKRVRRWALQTNASVRLRANTADLEEGGGGEQFVPWVEVAAGRRKADEVQWAAPKGYERAMHKCVAAYGCQVPRLCDMARESLWYDSVSDLVRGLDAIAADSGLEVESVKNAMGLAPTADATGGFRFVKVLLRLTGRESHELGVDGHVCEVLLLLKSLETLRTPDRHARFLEFRAARAAEVQLLLPALTELLWCGRGLARSVHSLLLHAQAPRSQAEHSHMPSAHSRTSSIHRRSWLGSVFSHRSSFAELQHVHDPASPQQPQEASEREVEADVMQREVRRVQTRLLSDMCAGEPGAIGERAKRLHEAVAAASTGSTLRMKRPIAAMLCKREFQALLISAGLLSLGIALSWFAADDAAGHARVFRFRALETRSGHPLPADPGIEHLVLWLDGCAVHPPPQSQRINGAEIWLEFAEAVSFDEWRFRTPRAGAAADDAARFTLEQQSLESGEWEEVGSSTWFGLRLFPTKFERGRFNAPEERGREVRMRAELEAAWVLEHLTASMVGLSMVVVGVCGVLQRQLLAVKVMKVLVSLTQLPSLCYCLLLFSDGRPREGWYFFANFVSGTVWVAMVAFREVWISDAFILVGLLSLSIDFTLKFLVLRPSSWAAYVEVFGVIYVTLGCIAKAYSWLNYRHALRVRDEDTAMYSKIWRQVEEEEGSVEELEQLRALTDSLQVSTEPRQRCLPWLERLDADAEAAQPEWWQGCSFTHSKLLYHVCPSVSSVDQLYAQAAAVSVLLRYKVAAWGRRTGGQCWVSERGGGQFVKLAELREEDEKRVRWAKTKAPARALEKKHRCYGGDSSRLCDLSRQTLVFQSVAELRGCMELMAADNEIQVLRVKNSLHASEVSSSGYRQVLVNLQLVTPLTERIGVALHVCEVQLLLRVFAEAKTSEGHRRYVAARNSRGE